MRAPGIVTDSLLFGEGFVLTLTQISRGPAGGQSFILRLVHFTLFLPATLCHGSGFGFLSLWPVLAALPQTKSALPPRAGACRDTAAAGTFTSMNRAIAHSQHLVPLPLGNRIPLCVYHYHFTETIIAIVQPNLPPPLPPSVSHSLLPSSHHPLFLQSTTFAQGYGFSFGSRLS